MQDHNGQESPEAWGPELVGLQETLARLYYNHANVVMALDDAGVDRRGIDLLAPTMRAVWRSALEVSLRQDRVGELARLAVKDHPGRTDLAPSFEASGLLTSAAQTSRPNPWCAARARLRNALCTVTFVGDTSLDLVSIARATGLDPSRLVLSSSPRFCWHTLLLEAERNGSLERVVAEVRREVPAMKARRAVEDEERPRRVFWVTWTWRVWLWFTTITGRVPSHLRPWTGPIPGLDDAPRPPWTDPIPELDDAWEALQRADASAAPPVDRQALPVPVLGADLSVLRDRLASRFLRPTEASIAALYADLDLRRVDRSGTSERFWTHLLMEAKRAGKLRGLIDAVLRAHPEAHDVAEAGQSLVETPTDAERSVPDEPGTEVTDGLDPTLFRARDLLVSLHPDGQSARRVAFIAGMEAAVNDVGSPHDVWTWVLGEAARKQQLPALFHFVREEHPQNHALREFVETYLEAHDPAKPPARS